MIDINTIRKLTEEAPTLEEQYNSSIIKTMEEIIEYAKKGYYQISVFPPNSKNEDRFFKYFEEMGFKVIIPKKESKFYDDIRFISWKE